MHSVTIHHFYDSAGNHLGVYGGCKEQDDVVTVDIIDIDRYKRYVGIVYKTDANMDTLDANMEMLFNGFAWYYAQYCKIQPTCEYYKTAEEVARKHNYGLWKYEHIAPWDYRKSKKK